MPKGAARPLALKLLPWPPARPPRLETVVPLHLKEFLKFQQMEGKEQAESHDVTDILQNIYFLFRHLFSNHNASYRTKVVLRPRERNPERALNG